MRSNDLADCNAVTVVFHYRLEHGIDAQSRASALSIRMRKLVALKAGGREFVARFAEGQNRVMWRRHRSNSGVGMGQGLLDAFGEFLLHLGVLFLIAADVFHSQNRNSRRLVLLKIRDLIVPRLPGIRSGLHQSRNHFRTLKRQVLFPVYRSE